MPAVFQRAAERGRTIMAIKVHCPTCKKNLAVPDEAAGKKVRCRGCKNILPVPAAAARPGPAAVPVSAPADAEALAASVFSDPPPAAAVEEPQFVEFKCPQCDEPLKLSADLAGKQSPCPSCRRIIKVPLPQKREAADWRNQQKKLPSGARQNFESDQPEGALAATAASTAVSQEALQEAGVIKEEREPLTARQWAFRIGAPVTALVVLVGVGITLRHITNQNTLDQAVEKAVKDVGSLKDKKPLFSVEAQAEVNRAAGEYYLHKNIRGCVDKANKYFREARSLLAGRSGYENDVALIELALSQIELGDDGKAVDNGERLSWKDTPNELRQTLEKIHSPEAKVLALHEVGRQLIAKGHQNVAALLATAVGNGHPDALGVVGLELLSADPKHAETLANQGLDSLPQAGAAPARQEAAPSSLIALCVALRPKEQDPCRGRLPEVPKQNESNDPNIPLGWIEGLGHQGNAAAARQLIGKLSTPQMAFQGYVTLAAAEAPDAAGPDVQEAIKLLETGTVSGKNVSSWLLLRLVQTAINAKLVEKAPVAANAIQDAGLRGRAQLAVLRAQLEAGKKKAETDQANVVDKQTPVHPLAWEALARNNARVDGGTLKAVQSWEEKVRPLGLVGAALGAQDAGH
jgi:ribosomal protein S27E